MRKNLWSARLTEFKQREKPETVLMVAGSADLMRIAVAWPGTLVVKKRRVLPCRCDEPESMWRWLWDSVAFSKEEFFGRVPGATEKTEQKFAALVANRVLYPDGTLNSFVEKYLQERVLTLFKIQRSA